MSAVVEVWRCRLDVGEERLRRLAATLGPDELDRAARLLDPVRRARALAFHGLRRAVLSRYVGLPPASLAFVRTPQGKPRLAGPQEGDVRFSVSRSGELGLVAVARGFEMGIDVERMEARRALGQIADRLFPAEETEELHLLAEPQRARRFYELWTRKEAHAKALGTGLTLPLDRLGAGGGRWSFHTVPMPAPYVCTLCVAASHVEVRVVDYLPPAEPLRAAPVTP